MLDQLDLVHMNGRIYDPLMARFLSADPMIQDPAHSQSYNRYTYVWNNPTNLTDPTGFTACNNDDKNCSSTAVVTPVKTCPKGATCINDTNGNAYQFLGYVRGNNSNSKDNSNGGGQENKSAANAANSAAGIVNLANSAVNGTRNFIDGGYGEIAGQAYSRGEYGSAVTNILAGTVYGLINIATFGEEGAIISITRTAGAKAAELVSSDAIPLISPTYRELKTLGIGGFQAHHILPQYLGKMLGYSEKETLDHPATLVSQWTHTGKLNPEALHKSISNYLPPMTNGQRATYTVDQIRDGLQRAYQAIERSDLFDSIQHLIK